MWAALLMPADAATIADEEAMAEVYLLPGDRLVRLLPCSAPPAVKLLLGTGRLAGAIAGRSIA